MSDVKFNVSAEGSAVDREFNRIAQQSLTTGQKMQSAFREASYRMAAAFKENTDKMNTSFDGMKSRIEDLRGRLAALAAVGVAARWAKGASDDAAAMAVSHSKLAAQLGISTSQVQVYDMALGDVNGTIEDLKNAHGKINNELLSNEDSFKRLGVSTRDANGNFRSTMDVMTDTNARLQQFKEGTDRNIEGMKVYGKAWPELMHLVGLTSEMMDDAAQDARNFGLIIGVENVEASKAYNQATGDVADMLTGLKKVVGDGVMPVFTQLSQWLVSIAPNAIAGLKVSVGVLVSLFWGLRMAVESVGQLIMLIFERMGARISQVVNVTMAAMRGDWSGAKSAWDTGQAELEAINKKRFGNILNIAEDTRKKIFALFSDVTPIAQQEGGASVSKGKDDTSKVNRSGEWENRLAELRDAYEKEKLAQGSFQEFSKEQERDYWKNILETVKMNADERRAVTNKIYAADREIRKADFEDSIAQMKADLAAYSSNGMERIQKAGEIAQKIGEKYGTESKEFKTAVAEVQAAAMAHAQQMEQISQIALERRRTFQLGELELETQKLEQMLAMGEVDNQQRLVQLSVLKDQEYQIELQAAMDRAAMLETDAVAYQQAMDKILEIKRKHEIDKKTIENEAARQNKADFDAMFSPISNSFNKALTGMMQGTQTWQQVVRNAGQNVVAEYATIGLKMFTSWAANELRKTMATAAGSQARVGIETAAAAQSTALSGSTTLVSIMNDAYEAMAGAYAAISGIPFVGPFLAPAVAAGAFTVVAGLAGSVMSAEGGYDIPGGVNPMTQLHEREMVLPSQHADVIRALGENGGLGASSGPPIILKGISSAKFFITERKSLVDALAMAGREFKK